MREEHGHQLPNKMGGKYIDPVTDWELDAVLGKGGRQAIVTLVERKSQYGPALIKKIKRRTAWLVYEAVIDLLSCLSDQALTLTRPYREVNK